MKKRFLSILLSIIMLLGMLPVTALPAFGEQTTDFSVYCLCGRINGDNYGMTEQSTPKWSEPGEYVFSSDGTLAVVFAEDSYVKLKTLHGEYWYAFEKYVADGTATKLYEARDTYKEDMFVPAGIKVTFTLSKDAAGALVLGYEQGAAAAFNVYFNMQGHGAKTGSQIVEEGGKVLIPADPTAEGYKFGGWYKEAQCINPWDFDTDTVTENTTIYAKWTSNSPSLEDGYYLVGRLNGEDLWDVSSLNSGMKLDSNVAVPGEYIIDWTFYRDDQVKIVKIDNGKITVWYNDGVDKFYTVSTDEAGDGTLYFRPEGESAWSYFFFTIKPKEEPSGDEYTVTFDLQDYGYLEGVEPIEPVSVKEGTTVEAPTAPYNSHYVFGGWYKEAQCINPWDFDSDTVTEDITLYAKCIPGSCTLWFYLGDEGDTRIRLRSARYGDPMPKVEPPARDGFIFLGYYDVGEMGAPSVKYYNADGTSARNWDKETATATLIAHWAPSGTGGHTHTYGESTYIWNEDLTKCTAIKTCECGNAVIETVEAEKSGNTITATFTKDGFIAQVKTVEEVEDEAAKALAKAITAAKSEIDKLISGADDDIVNCAEAAKADIEKLTDIADVTEKLTEAIAEINNMKTAKAITAALSELEKAASGLKTQTAKAVAGVAEALIRNADSEDEVNTVLTDALEMIAAAEAEAEPDEPTEPTNPEVCSKCGHSHSNDFFGQILCFLYRVINWFRNLFK